MRILGFFDPNEVVEGEIVEEAHDHSKCCNYNFCAHPMCCGYYGPLGRIAQEKLDDLNRRKTDDSSVRVEKDDEG